MSVLCVASSHRKWTYASYISFPCLPEIVRQFRTVIWVVTLLCSSFPTTGCLSCVFCPLVSLISLLFPIACSLECSPSNSVQYIWIQYSTHLGVLACALRIICTVYTQNRIEQKSEHLKHIFPLHIHSSETSVSYSLHSVRSCGVWWMRIMCVFVCVRTVDLQYPPFYIEWTRCNRIA